MIRKKAVLLLVLLTLPCIAHAAMPDFGQDGRKGLTPDQLKRLAQGAIVFTYTDAPTADHSGLIEAAVVFNKPPEQAWDLLSRTEDQANYLKELEISRIITKDPHRDTIEFKIKAAFMAIVYRANHNFDKAHLYFSWGLDPRFSNDLEDLRGFWRFYPYGNGQTLARYGSTVAIKNVPSFIEDIFKKSGIERSLGAVKRYVDSGGTYHK